jgi:cytochrome c-type biogenesis protein CcmH/NrfG
MKRFIIILFLFFISAALICGCSSKEEKRRSHFDQGEYKSAKLELKNAIQIDPYSVHAYLKLGETSLKLQDAQGAFDAYSKVVELDPENTEAQLKLSAFYMLGKEFEEARKKIDALLAKDSGKIEALLLYPKAL